MKVLDPRKLLLGEKREVEAGGSVRTLFKTWVRLMKDIGNDVDESDPNVFSAFYTGYVLANPIVREQYQKAYKDKFGEESAPVHYHISAGDNW